MPWRSDVFARFGDSAAVSVGDRRTRAAMSRLLKGRKRTDITWLHGTKHQAKIGTGEPSAGFSAAFLAVQRGSFDVRLSANRAVRFMPLFIRLHFAVAREQGSDRCQEKPTST